MSRLSALPRSKHRARTLRCHSEGGFCPRNLSSMSDQREIPHSADSVRNDVIRVGLLVQSDRLTSPLRLEKRRQAAALQNVGMPTIKVLLEVPYWNFGVGE